MEDKSAAQFFMKNNLYTLDEGYAKKKNNSLKNKYKLPFNTSDKETNYTGN